ncbi:PP2C family protein-serine/threonine phosphatase [Actinoplanes sp. NEAU-A12]|uniref:PP2C family protein-serine/threonine phosphatase n=1 Tax=Actinoplanes sandaracinus TaxID=3045177 RepID=A0ABT6WGV4_9ACTN|nr:PP2C family protein-serine/threonine phosphatase [Actinoplanes sandaracinus]MDI6098956.1 PP2C family protein-serine/threonine phosphatase [Actinoplanes sandaracinus]
MAAPMRVVQRLLGLRHLDELPAALVSSAPLLGAVEVAVLLADYEQLALWPFTRGDARAASSVAIDGTAAGRAYASARPVRETGDAGVLLWLPLSQGAHRLGVLRVTLRADPGDESLRALSVIAALVAELICGRRLYGDAVEHTRRRLPMQLAAEIIWNQLPPLSLATGDTVITAVLEPSYDVGGDTFDYAANGATVHVALFDTVGHGIAASALATLALNTYRNARRCGLSLTDTYRSIDKWVRAHHHGAFVTAVLAELDTTTGLYRRICAGHPAELLLRGGTPLPPLPGPTALPLGLAHMRAEPPRVTQHLLEPGDTLLLYTDGITESRSADGELFGLDRLSAFVTAALARRTPPAEIMRRLIQTIVSYEAGELHDDATAALLQWHPAPTP